MFKGLRETIKGLNSDVKTVANCEKAKKLRKNLLIIGFIMAIVGIIGTLVCVGIVFSNFFDMGDSVMSSSLENNDSFGKIKGFGKDIFVPFIIIIPFGILASIGIIFIKLGFSILVTGFATNLIDEAVGNNCPNCGKRVEGEKSFCSNCGHQLNKQCSHCGHVNHFKNVHCEKCGRKL